MATAVKRKLSGSTDGRGVKVVATASAGTTIHTAVSGTTAGTFDEIWLFGYNGDSGSVTLTIQFGGTSTPDDDMIITLGSKTGLQLLVPGLILQNATIVKAYASVANVIILSGFVNAITD